MIAPQGPWLRIWALGCLLAALALGGLELTWRQLGHRPRIVPSVEHWAYHRELVEGADRSTVALLGTSRMLFGFRPEAFAEVLPDIDAVLLAVNGLVPFATLIDLAGDDSFAGVVVCALDEVTLDVRWPDQRGYVDYFHETWTRAEKLSLFLSAALEDHLVVLQPTLTGRGMFEELLAGRLPDINIATIRFDRSRIVDHSLLTEQEMIDAKMLRIKRVRSRLSPKPPVPKEKWLRWMKMLKRQVDAIEERGGRVVFVRFPISGRFLELNRKFVPRERYWDTLASTTGAVTLHFQDMPGHEALVLPDDTHLNLESARAFTRWIASELKSRGVVD